MNASHDNPSAAATAEPAFEMPEMPRPQFEHDWLQQFVGEWESEAKCFMDPDGPPQVARGTERIRALGGFWVVSEIESSVMGRPYRTVQILGFDPRKEKFTGTWVDTMTSYLWTYEGTLDEFHTTLTLETEGPCQMLPNGITKFREVLELKDPNHKVYTSSILHENGFWKPCLIAEATRRPE